MPSSRNIFSQRRRSCCSSPAHRPKPGTYPGFPSTLRRRRPRTRFLPRNSSHKGADMATHVLEGKCGSTQFKMLLDKDVEIRLRDGAIVRADVYRPESSGRCPALVTYGPYGKDSHISQFMGSDTWERLKSRRPGITGGTSGKYIVFERPNPEQWALHGYAVVH